MRHLLLLSLLISCLLAGCSRSTDRPPEGAAGKIRQAEDLPKYVEVDPTPPRLGQASYRPEFTFSKGAPLSAGTAFTVRMTSGDVYLLTAAHLMEPDEWKSVREVSL